MGSDFFCWSSPAEVVISVLAVLGGEEGVLSGLVSALGERLITGWGILGFVVVVAVPVLVVVGVLLVKAT